MVSRSVSEIGIWNRSRKAFSASCAEFLGLVRDHLPFAGRAHAIAFDGFGEDDGRLAPVINGGLVSGIRP